MSETFECNSPDVVFEDFGDETILLNLISGAYYSLNPTGMAIWELLSQSVPASAVTEFLSSGAPRQPGISADVDRLTGELLKEQLLRPSALVRAATDVAPALKPPVPYETPTLDRFDDVAELLLLDPVHDVSDAGWPHPAPPAAQPPLT